nr:hypothetical protein 12 [Gammaproteobacteria bacterium]
MPRSDRDHVLDIRERVKVNVTRNCSVDGCYKHRHNLTTYCNNHFQKFRNYGHAEVGAIKPFHMKEHKQLTRKVVERNLDHPKLSEAIEKMTTELDNAAGGHPREYGFEFARFGMAGVDAIEILVTASAVWMIDMLGFTEYTRTLQSRTTQTGHNVLKLTRVRGLLEKGAYKISPRKRKVFGLWITKEYGKVVGMITRAALEDYKAEQERMIAAARPLKTAEELQEVDHEPSNKDN